MARRSTTNQLTLDARRREIPTRTLQEEVEGAFLEYAMSVIVQRALPDVRDGLKPVQRRILWAMHDANLRPDRPFVKCARVVGEVMANYHPHGDTAIYDALVRMGQTFSLTAPLIDKHGNFGSPSDPPAASRYTECRLSPLAMELLAGIDEGTVDFEPNYDGSRTEPAVLPARFPEPAGERRAGDRGGDGHQHPAAQPGRGVQRGAEAHRQARRRRSSELMRIVKGPDFPTGGLIMGDDGIKDAFRTGRGTRARARASTRSRTCRAAVARRSCSPRSRSRPVSTRSRASSPSSSCPARSTASATSATSPVRAGPGSSSSCAPTRTRRSS